MPSVSRRLRLHEGVLDRHGLRRRRRAIDLRGLERGHESDHRAPSGTLGMKLGVALEGIRPAAELHRLAARIEALRFDSLWTPDHVAFSQPISDPFQVLAACAAATTRIRLGTCVYLLPLRHPTHVAKMAA